jgi:hypothetical protein
MDKIDVYLEEGEKRVFAGALAWPGWSRSGRSEEQALQALAAYGARYADVLQGTTIAFQPPGDTTALRVIEILPGSRTTDFGAPDAVPAYDNEPVGAEERQRYEELLRAYWRAFDAAVDTARGRELRKGPRGGGRELEGIVEHVVEADKAYLRRLAWKVEKADETLAEALTRSRAEILEALAVAVRDGLPAEGPRGGKIWTVRYFVRRVAWHVLDHAWEIEDRLL